MIRFLVAAVVISASFVTSAEAGCWRRRCCMTDYCQPACCQPACCTACSAPAPCCTAAIPAPAPTCCTAAAPAPTCCPETTCCPRLCCRPRLFRGCCTAAIQAPCCQTAYATTVYGSGLTAFLSPRRQRELQREMARAEERRRELEAARLASLRRSNNSRSTPTLVSLAD